MMPDNYVYELILSDEQHTELLTCIQVVRRFYKENGRQPYADAQFWNPRIAAAERLYEIVLNTMPIDLNLMEKEARDHAPG